MDNYSVYMHKNKTNGKIYIGITRQNPEHRWANGTGYKTNYHFWNAIEKYGWNDGFEHMILKTGLSKIEACNWEKKLISLHQSNDPCKGYNNTIGGECGTLTPIEILNIDKEVVRKYDGVDMAKFDIDIEKCESENLIIDYKILSEDIKIKRDYEISVLNKILFYDIQGDIK